MKRTILESARLFRGYPQVKFFSTFSRAIIPQRLSDSFDKSSHRLIDLMRSNNSFPPMEDMIHLSKKLLLTLNDDDKCQESKNLLELLRLISIGQKDAILFKGVPTDDKYKTSIFVASLTIIAGFRPYRLENATQDKKPFVEISNKENLDSHTDNKGDEFKPDLISIIGMNVEKDNKTETYTINNMDVFNAVNPETREILFRKIFYDEDKDDAKPFSVFSYQGPNNELSINYRSSNIRSALIYRLDKMGSKSFFGRGGRVGEAKEIEEAIVAIHDFDEVLQDLYQQEKCQKFCLEQGDALFMRNVIHGRKVDKGSIRDVLGNFYCFDDGILEELDSLSPKKVKCPTVSKLNNSVFLDR